MSLCLQEQLTEITFKILLVCPENSTKRKKNKKQTRVVIGKFFCVKSKHKN